MSLRSSTGLLVLVSSLLGHLLQVTSYRLPLREPEGPARIEARDLLFMFFHVEIPSLQNSTLEPTWRQTGAKIASKSEPGRIPGGIGNSLFSKKLENLNPTIIVSASRSPPGLAPIVIIFANFC